MKKKLLPSPSYYLTESVEQYREVLEEMDDIIMIIDRKGTIEYVNRTLRNILGYKKKYFTGKNITDCFRWRCKDEKETFINKIFTTKEFVRCIFNREGKCHHFAWKTKLFTQHGKEKVLAVLRDISLSHKLQEKVKRYAENLEEMVFQRTREIEKERQKAIDLHQAKAIFISKMSHELRTPLTAISGYVDLMKDPSLDKKDFNLYLEVIERNTRNMLEMITETLEMIRIEQDKYQIQDETFDLHLLTKEVVETYQVLAEEKGIHLYLRINDTVPQYVYSDPRALSHILTNLISNSIKFTERGEITLELSVLSRKNPILKQYLHCVVRDTGVGIPKAYHEQVFRSFHQYLNHQPFHSKGTGLGLSISHQLAKLLGGKLKLVSSIPQEGSAFLFTLPLRLKTL